MPAGRVTERLVGVAGRRARADLILLAGDLTLHGDPEEVGALVEAVQGLETPVFAVLGNHDWHGNRCDELTAVLSQAGIRMLDKVRRDRSGDVGRRGGRQGLCRRLPGLRTPRLRRASLRRVYAETTDEVEGLARGLDEIAACDVRIALLHYADECDARGRAAGIWAFLGSDELAVPIAQHRPDIVSMATATWAGSRARSASPGLQRGSTRDRERLRDLRAGRLGSDDLDDPASLALAVELEEEHALPGAGQSSPSRTGSPRRPSRAASTCSASGRCRRSCPPRRCSPCGAPSRHARSTCRSGRGS